MRIADSLVEKLLAKSKQLTKEQLEDLHQQATKEKKPLQDLVIEQIFSIPGIGRQVLLGLNQKEYAVVQSTVLVIAVMFVAVNLLTDLLYRWVDPKVRVE